MIANSQAIGSSVVTFALLLAGCGFDASPAKQDAVLAPAPGDNARLQGGSERATAADVEGPLEILPDLGKS